MAVLWQQRQYGKWGVERSGVELVFCRDEESVGMGGVMAGYQHRGEWVMV